MRKFPCKKCKQCGKYSDLAALVCECGEDISMLDATLVDVDSLQESEKGEIDTELKVYMQKCSACGALNFTISEDEPVKMCYNCHKARIATVAPVAYRDEEKTVPEYEPEEEETEASTQMNYNMQQKEKYAAVKENTIEDDDDDDEDSLQWQNILGGIKSEMQQEAPKDVAASSQNITLTAVRYGHFSYTVKAADTPFLLGRDANFKDFLEQDGRVSNEHCILYCREGKWFVKDNHSTNGTAVNSRDIGLNGEHELCDGDELKLGHHQDSMAFRVIVG